MKNLLVITNIYPPQNLGGFGICIERLTQGMSRLGHRTIVLTSNESYLGEAGEENNIKTIYGVGGRKVQSSSGLIEKASTFNFGEKEC